MRFAYLSCDFGVRAFGESGASVHVREMVRALRRIGHEVEFFAPELGLGPSERPREGYHALPLDRLAEETALLLAQDAAPRSSHLVREWRRVLYSEQLRRALGRVFDERPPDAIYERYSLFAYAGLELARRARRPLLLEVNAPLCREAATHRELVLRRTAAHFERRVLSGADAVFAVSAEVADHARRLGVAAERLEVLPNGVDPDRFHPGTSGARLRARLGLEGRRVIGFVGTLRPWHDLDTLLAAARRLARDDPELRLLVVGAGPRLEAVRRSGTPFVLCPGALPHEAVPEALAVMDVVVVPYAKDGDSYFSPIKLFEAMAAARPVVGARWGQVARVLRHGETGLLYEPGQAEDLAARARSLLDRPDWAARLGSAARAWVIERHTWESNARRVAERAVVCRARLEGSP
jgi:glycosyltransferase involved in cell wall biosynthesis